jgi:hypothetical protein
MREAVGTASKRKRKGKIRRTFLNLTPLSEWDAGGDFPCIPEAIDLSVYLVSVAYSSRRYEICKCAWISVNLYSPT